MRGIGWIVRRFGLLRYRLDGVRYQEGGARGRVFLYFVLDSSEEYIQVEENSLKRRRYGAVD